MLNAEAFIEAARGLGFTRYTGVPCSYLTPFINYVINDDKLTYISSANEGDAVATAAGLTALPARRAVAMMQNSGLGNAVNPLTSLANTFDIPLLLIVTHRGKPGRRDEPQHELMGRITGGLFDLMEIPWEPFPTAERDIGPALERAHRHCTGAAKAVRPADGTGDRGRASIGRRVDSLQGRGSLPARKTLAGEAEHPTRDQKRSGRLSASPPRTLPS